MTQTKNLNQGLVRKFYQNLLARAQNKLEIINKSEIDSSCNDESESNANSSENDNKVEYKHNLKLLFGSGINVPVQTNKADDD